jgi:hypothetical protein
MLGVSRPPYATRAGVNSTSNMGRSGGNFGLKRATLGRRRIRLNPLRHSEESGDRIRHRMGCAFFRQLRMNRTTKQTRAATDTTTNAAVIITSHNIGMSLHVLRRTRTPCVTNDQSVLSFRTTHRNFLSTSCLNDLTIYKPQE